jgi:hypothetical protein
MKKLSMIVALCISFCAASALAGDSDPRAGTKGHVTAYDGDNATILDVDPCPRTKLAYDYAACGKPFREKVSRAVCRKHGDGTHKWFYQVGDARQHVAQTAICK